MRDRIEEISGLASNMGAAAEITATAAGEESTQSTTDCEPGVKLNRREKAVSNRSCNKNS